MNRLEARGQFEGLLREDMCDNYVPPRCIELDEELSWLFTNILSDTIQMKVKRMGTTEILRRTWLFSASKYNKKL